MGAVSAFFDVLWRFMVSIGLSCISIEFYHVLSPFFDVLHTFTHFYTLYHAYARARIIIINAIHLVQMNSYLRDNMMSE